MQLGVAFGRQIVLEQEKRALGNHSIHSDVQILARDVEIFPAGTELRVSAAAPGGLGVRLTAIAKGNPRAAGSGQG